MSSASAPGCAAVQATNDDASASKLSCVKKGYIRDNYVHFFVRRPVKRAPLINRGYYARWAVIRRLISQFLASDPSSKKQILSLGAGFDTTFFQLEEEGKAPFLYVEFDFLEVTSRKAALIASRALLGSKLGTSASILPDKGEVKSDHYKLLPVDMRDITRMNSMYEQAQLDPSLPTLILAECVLIYMEPDSSRAIIRWVAEKFSTAAFVIYEQILPDDAFGRQMIINLESRGCPLLGIHDTPTLEAKRRRFTELGWQRTVALSMEQIYKQHLDVHDKRRIERLEIFDEFEEWHIMQEHYCVAYGINDPNGVLVEFGFKD